MKTGAANAVKKPETGGKAEAGEVKEFKKNGISVRIRPAIKDGVTRFVLDYRANGQRKLVWRSSLVPLKENLKAFLLPMAKKNGKVISLANTTKHLLKAAADTADAEREIEALAWKHNALRHTYISARVAESGDVPRVADEAGNSPQVIRTNYLKRMRPAAAAEWFAIMPPPETGR